MEEVNLKQVQPRANTVITTAYRYYENNGKAKEAYIKDRTDHQHIITTAESKNLPLLYQRVVAVGNVVRDVKVGDIVKINPLYYLDRKLVAQRESLQKDVLDMTGTRVIETYSELDYKFPFIKLDGEEHILLYDRDIDYVVIDAEGLDYLK